MDDLIGLLRKAGFRGEGLRNAYGVVMKESSGNPRAFNGNRGTGDQSYGLFQINMLGSLGPARRKQFGISSNEDLFDPLTNAKAAFRMSNGGKDFGAWGIGPNAYRKLTAAEMSRFERGRKKFDRIPIETLPARPGQKPPVQTLPLRPGEKPQIRQLTTKDVFQRGLTLDDVRRGGWRMSRHEIWKNGLTIKDVDKLRKQALRQVQGRSAVSPTRKTSMKFAPSGSYPWSFFGSDIKWNPLGTPNQGTHSQGIWQSNQGWDYGAPVGTPVYAPFAGTIGDRFGNLEGVGGRMYLNTPKGQMYLAHLDPERLMVNPGQKIDAGTLLGYIGLIQGMAPHLHAASSWNV